MPIRDETTTRKSFKIIFCLLSVLYYYYYFYLNYEHNEFDKRRPETSFRFAIACSHQQCRCIQQSQPPSFGSCRRENNFIYSCLHILDRFPSNGKRIEIERPTIATFGWSRCFYFWLRRSYLEGMLKNCFMSKNFHIMFLSHFRLIVAFWLNIFQW